MPLVQDREIKIYERGPLRERTHDPAVRRVFEQYIGMGYNRDFRDLLKHSPGILSSVIALTRKAEDKYNPPDLPISNDGTDNILRWNKLGYWQYVRRLDKDLDEPISLTAGELAGMGVIFRSGERLVDPEHDLQITVLGKSNRIFGGGRAVARIDVSTYLKMEHAGTSYFVKKSLETHIPGFDEFKSTLAVRRILSGMENVQVVDPQFGYFDGKESWFVSKWEKLDESGYFPFGYFQGIPNIYGKLMPIDEFEEFHLGTNQEAAKLAFAVEQIKKRIEQAGIILEDLEPNLFYNPRTRKIFLVDVTSRYNVSLDQLRIVN